MTDSKDLRDLLRAGADRVPPLDPAKVIAGAHHRRRVRGLVTAGVACAAVVAVIAGGVVIANGPAGDLLPGPPAAGSPTQSPSAGTTTGPTAPRTPGPPTVDLAACLSALTDTTRPGLRPDARVGLRLDTATGTTLVIADRKTWLGCDRSRQRMARPPSILEPGPLTPPTTETVNPFRVSSVSVDVGASAYDRYWAAGVLPAGVTAIRYTFPDGAVRGAKVTGRFWAVQYQRTRPTPPGQDRSKQPRIKVDLRAADGRVVTTFWLDWSKDVCAHVNHGC